jgi:hypothetical protein
VEKVGFIKADHAGLSMPDPLPVGNNLDCGAQGMDSVGLNNPCNGPRVKSDKRVQRKEGKFVNHDLQDVGRKLSFMPIDNDLNRFIWG